MVKKINSLLIFVFVLATTSNAQNYSGEIIISNVNSYSIYAIDLDGDNDIDILCDDGFYINWYENDGNENYTEHQISTLNAVKSSTIAIDLDEDEDIDIISTATSPDEKTSWFKNDGTQSFTENNVGFSEDRDLYAVDVDGDDDIDIVYFCSYNGNYYIKWYENNGSQSFTSNNIAINENDGLSSIYVIDVDSDGDIDVLSTSWADDKIFWYENDGTQNFAEHIITDTIFSADDVFAIDMDNDGDIDVLSISDNSVTWYENNGYQSFTGHLISNNYNNNGYVIAIDLDNDNDIDILSSEGGNLIMHINDGNQNFSSNIISSGFNPYMIIGIDIDGDNDIDILANNNEKVVWFRNICSVITDSITGETSPEQYLQYTYSILDTLSSSFEWFANNATIIENNNTSITLKWNNAGTNILKLVETQNDGCIGDTVYLQVDVQTCQINTDNITGESNPEQYLQYSYSVIDTIGSTFEWITNDATIIENNNTSITLKWNIVGVGILKLVETRGSDCIGDTVIFQANIQECQINTGNIVGNPNPAPYETSSYAIANNQGSTYEWLVNGGVVTINNGNYIEVLWGADGLGSLCVIETNDIGCIGDTICMDISVNTKEIYNTKEFGIYPNPSNGKVQLIVSKEQIGNKIEITNINGKIIKQFNIENNTFTIDLINQTRGVYFIKLIGKNSVSTQKLILN